MGKAKGGKTIKARRDWTVPFLKALESNGVVTHAASKAGIGRRTAYDRRSVDPAFAAAWDDAVELAIGTLEAECYRRAVHGVERPVYQGGVLVGTVREYSDTLLIFLLKALKPEKYREPRGFAAVVNVNVAPAVLNHVAKAALEAAQLAADGERDLAPAE